MTTGEEWHFDEGVNVANLASVPATLSAAIFPRPTDHHFWGGGERVLNQALKNAARRAEIEAELSNIDLKSIRSIRERNAAKIQDFENSAIALRAELIGLP